MATDLKQPPLHTFQYTPIWPGYIRVLDLVRSPDGPLRCSLRTVKLDDPDTVFTALSYVWGDGAQPFSMDVVPDNRTIPLTSSLHNALQDLCDCADVQPKTFWADQICINQKDDEEKSHQVAQMDQVYKCAKRVVTYLGHSEEGDIEALELWEGIHDHFNPLMDTTELAQIKDENLAQFSSMYSRMYIDEIPEELQFPEEIWEGDGLKTFERLASIVSGPWITRVWLVQENILNVNTVFLRGTRTMPWDHMLMVCIISYIGLVPNIRGNEAILRFFRLREAWWNRRSITTGRLKLDNVMTSLSVTWKCFDPRDRLYSVLGLAIDARELGFVRPDYKKSTAQVFTDIAVAFVQRRIQEDPKDSLFILRGVSIEPSTHTGMPSWVPTYSDLPYKERRHSKMNASQTYGNETARKLAAQVLFESTESVGNGALVAKGLRLNLKLRWCFGIFPDGWLRHSFTNDQRDQILTTLLRASGSFDSDLALALLYETILLGLETVETNESQEAQSSAPQVTEAEAAQGMRDMISLFERTKSGDEEVWYEDGRFDDYFYLSTETLPRESAAHRLVENSTEFMNRSFWAVETSDGFYCPCIAPKRAQAGDIPVILFGAHFICFLRPRDGMFEYLGMGYIPGFMKGEPFAMENWIETVEDFHIL